MKIFYLVKENLSLVKHLYQWMQKTKLIFKDFRLDKVEHQSIVSHQKFFKINVYQKNLIFIRWDQSIIICYMVKLLLHRMYKIFKIINFHKMYKYLMMQKYS